GSDHDVFLGLGIPATMFGHDPDWTHHTSEDKIDKTDASEFRRVGVFATAGAYWTTTMDPEQWLAFSAVQSTARIAELTHRLTADASMGRGSDIARRIKINRDELANESASLLRSLETSTTKIYIDDRFPRVTLGPHRLTLLPLDASVFENVSPEDKKWLAEQEARFASDSEGLATKPNFALISFEAVNFMDGHRSTVEIADLLSAEYLVDIDQAWVDRLVSILEKEKLAAK
ncbi:MAG TPA: hypothetical protein VLA83_02025, partial [Candidatus Binatia bacterium]|nr:hypothetical protein [Candidatus Binatia bacterium]